MAFTAGRIILVSTTTVSPLARTLALSHSSSSGSRRLRSAKDLGADFVLTDERSNVSTQALVEMNPVEVVNAVGAGDTFQAAMLTSLAEQGLLSSAALAALSASRLKTALELASAAAVITCPRRDASARAIMNILACRCAPLVHSQDNEETA